MSPRCFGSGSLSVHRPVDCVCTVCTYIYIRILAWCGVGPRVLCDIVGRTNAARPGFNGLMVCLPVVGFAFGLCDNTSTPYSGSSGCWPSVWLRVMNCVEVLKTFPQPASASISPSPVPRSQSVWDQSDQLLSTSYPCI
jgi:hypothetical protein